MGNWMSRLFTKWKEPNVEDDVEYAAETYPGLVFRRSCHPEYMKKNDDYDETSEEIIDLQNRRNGF